jgi:DNA (cytosine-5)-methyltransferase 1
MPDATLDRCRGEQASGRMTFGSLFSGIGGLDLGLERAGMECRFQVEIDPFCRKVLTKHWPEVPKYGDIRETTGESLGYVDLMGGGFPCQDLSCAGRRAGIDGARSGLWAEYARLIGEIRPRFILIENVSGLLVGGAMRRVLGDLFTLGFDAEWRVFRASQFAIPHQRARVFVLAYPEGFRPKSQPILCGTKPQDPLWKLGEFDYLRDASILRPIPHGIVHGVANGLSLSVDRCKSLGNAVVPQVAEWIGRQIMECVA